MKQIGSVKPWVTDSTESGVFSKFWCMNAGLGNRFPTSNGFMSESCPFCLDLGLIHTNNEVHLVVECSHFQAIRDLTIIQELIMPLKPYHDSVYIYKYLMDDTRTFCFDVRRGLAMIYEKWKTDIESNVNM